MRFKLLISKVHFSFNLPSRFSSKVWDDFLQYEMHAKLCAIKPLKQCLILRCKKMTNAHGINGETFNGTNTFYTNWP
jgi:hypothetical protein